MREIDLLFSNKLMGKISPRDDRGVKEEIRPEEEQDKEIVASEELH